MLHTNERPEILAVHDILIVDFDIIFVKQTLLDMAYPFISEEGRVAT